jgi:hypothetical protein
VIQITLVGIREVASRRANKAGLVTPRRKKRGAGLQVVVTERLAGSFEGAVIVLGVLILIADELAENQMRAVCTVDWFVITRGVAGVGIEQTENFLFTFGHLYYTN